MTEHQGFISGTIPPFTADDVRRGALGLLRNAAQVGERTRLLLVNEEGGAVEPEVAALLAAEARALGADVQSVWAPAVSSAAEVSPALLEASVAVDVTIFSHQMATMMRFAPLGDDSRRINNFAKTQAALAATARIAPAPHWYQLIAAVNDRLGSARHWRVTCPYGTDIEGGTGPAAPSASGGAVSPMPTYPAGVHKPLSSLNANGRLAVKWLVSGGMHVFEPSSIVLETPVILEIQEGRITDVSGARLVVDRLRGQLERVGAAVGKEGFIVNSWHCGVNGDIAPVNDAESDVEAWFAIAHTSARIAHFHAVGAEAPGEISLPCIDPTVVIDGETIWEGGKLRLRKAAPDRA